MKKELPACLKNSKFMGKIFSLRQSCAEFVGVRSSPKIIEEVPRTTVVMAAEIITQVAIDHVMERKEQFKSVATLMDDGKRKTMQTLTCSSCAEGVNVMHFDDHERTGAFSLLLSKGLTEVSVRQHEQIGCQKMGVKMKYESFSRGEVRLSGVPLLPGKKYDCVFSASLVDDVTADRVITSLKSLSLQMEADMSPLVRAILSAGPKNSVQPVTNELTRAFGLKSALTYVWGAPGSGKTQWIAEFVKMFKKTKGSALVVAETNSAVVTVVNRVSSVGVFTAHVIAPIHNGKFDVRPLSQSCTFDKHKGLVSRKSRVPHASHGALVVACTVSTALSAGAGIFMKNVDCLIIDEGSLIPYYSFLALLALNPKIVILVGDHMQNPPFDALSNSVHISKVDLEIARLSEHSPIHVHRLYDDSLVLGDFKMRMEQSFSRLFADFFYRRRIDYKLKDVPMISSFSVAKPLSIYFKIGTSTVNLHSIADYMGKIKEGSMVVTPYAKQTEFWNRFLPTVSTRTMRPAQGDEADEVVIDLVNGRGWSFVTTSMMIVALSRFRKKVLVLHPPRAKAKWFGGNYFYDENSTIQANYDRLKSNIDSVYGKEFTYDMNGHHFIAWRFFIWIIMKLNNVENYFKSPVFRRMEKRSDYDKEVKSPAYRSDERGAPLVDATWLKESVSVQLHEAGMTAVIIDDPNGVKRRKAPLVGGDKREKLVVENRKAYVCPARRQLPLVRSWTVKEGGGDADLSRERAAAAKKVRISSNYCDDEDMALLMPETPYTGPDADDLEHIESAFDASNS